MLTELKVKNRSKKPIMRANRVFPIGRTVVLTVDTDTARYKEIRACKSLHIVEETPECLAAPEPATLMGEVTVDAPVTPPADDADATDDGDNIDPADFAGDDEDNEDATIDPPADVEPVTKTDKRKQRLTCPWCEKEGTVQALYPHVRIQHPEHYDEFKARIKGV